MPVDPALSVIVPTHGRPDAIVRLLRGLSRQTLAADRFEVIVTDDGTDPPVAPALAALGLPFRFECHWQPQSGPAAARNRAIARARAPFLLILNDDAGPPDDLLERHLAAQQRSPSPRAFLGGFDFAPECLTPFARAITRLGVVFPFDQMRREGPNGGNFFWTCNLSVPRQPVVDAGGFDESFAQPICEDVELGVRLHKRGVAVHWLEQATCLHHHRVDVHWFVRRQVELGRNMVKLWRKHHDPELLPWIRAANGDEAQLADALECEVRARGRQFEVIVREIDENDRDLEPLCQLVKRVNVDSLQLGLLAGLRGWETKTAWSFLAALPPLTTLFVRPDADLVKARRARLLAGAPVELLSLPERAEGGPSLRERLLAAAHGEQIGFLDGGFAGEPGWLAAALRSMSGSALVQQGCFRLVRRAELDVASVTR